MKLRLSLLKVYLTYILIAAKPLQYHDASLQMLNISPIPYFYFSRSMLHQLIFHLHLKEITYKFMQSSVLGVVE